jgi:hypothetical protein
LPLFASRPWGSGLLDAGALFTVRRAFSCVPAAPAGTLSAAARSAAQNTVAGRYRRHRGGRRAPFAMSPSPVPRPRPSRFRSQRRRRDTGCRSA